MERKRLTMFLVMIGGWLGGYVPLLWGAGYFSMASILFSTTGAIIGIWLAFKLTQ